MSEDDILIDEHGNIRFVYSDLLDSVFADEPRDTKRASHVEPAYGGGWKADMSPVGGPVLYDLVEVATNRWEHRPFKTRAEALDAERKWLRENHNL